MELDTNVVILVLGTLVSVIGGTIGVKLVSTRHQTPEYQLEKLKNLQGDYDDIKKENRYLRGKVSQVRQKFQVDDNFDLDNDSDIVSLAKSILPNVIDFLPKDVQKQAAGFLSNPDIIELANELYKKHPEEVKKFLGGFLKKSSSQNSSNSEESAPALTSSEGGA